MVSLKERVRFPHIFWSADDLLTSFTLYCFPNLLFACSNKFQIMSFLVLCWLRSFMAVLSNAIILDLYCSSMYYCDHAFFLLKQICFILHISGQHIETCSWRGWKGLAGVQSHAVQVYGRSPYRLDKCELILILFVFYELSAVTLNTMPNKAIMGKMRSKISYWLN